MCINGNVTIIIVYLQDQDMEGIGMATLKTGTVIVIEDVLIHTTNMIVIQIDYYLMSFAVVGEWNLVLEEKEVFF